MSYIVKRYTHGLKRYKAWLLLSFLMPGLYLLSAFYTPVQHTVSQRLRLAPETPFASASFNTMADVVADQAIFFRQNFHVNRYFNLSAEDVKHLEAGRYRQITDAIAHDLALAQDGESARVTYRGNDPELGDRLVTYYARRLVRQAREGIAHSGLQVAQTRLPKLDGGIETSVTRALWHPDRLPPLITLLIASALAVLVLIAALEWNDAALKSERQIARYVNLPVLGSLPDLNRISRILVKEPSTDGPDPRP